MASIEAAADCITVPGPDSWIWETVSPIAICWAEGLTLDGVFPSIMVPKGGMISLNY